MMISLFFFTDSPVKIPPAFADPTEDKAIDELAQKMLADADKLKGKRIGLFKFTSIEGKETQEGARVSDSLLEKLMGKSSLKFIDRTELRKIIAENELEQTGLIDTNLVQENGKVLPIDLMITGTFAKINTEVTISARVVNSKTGELSMIKTCRYNSKQSGNSTDSAEAVALFKKSPDELDRINRAFYNLQFMSKNAPLIFLITVVDKSEIENFEKNQPKIANSLKKRKEKLDKENPEKIKKIQDLRKNLALMKEYFPKRYDIIMAKKIEVINSRPGKR
jgi:hypothetical protein